MQYLSLIYDQEKRWTKLSNVTYGTTRCTRHTVPLSGGSFRVARCAQSRAGRDVPSHRVRTLGQTPRRSDPPGARGIPSTGTARQSLSYGGTVCVVMRNSHRSGRHGSNRRRGGGKARYGASGSRVHVRFEFLRSRRPPLGSPVDG